MAPTRKSRSVKKWLSEVYEELPDKDAGNGNKRGQRKRKLSDVLGSQWSKEEIRCFYEAYRKYGKDWKKVASVVRSRSVEMVEALYNMNRAYLSLPEGTATVVGLIAMMTDHYNIMDGSESEQESNSGPGTFRKPPKRGREELQHNVSKGLDGHVPDLLHSQSFVSSFGCPSLLKKMRSGGSRFHAFGKRTPRFPVDWEKDVSPIKQGPKSDIDFDEVAHGAALALAEALQRGGSSQVFQTPNRRMEGMRPSPVWNGEEMHPESEMVGTKLIGTAMNEGCWKGSLGSREAKNGDFSRDTNGLGTVQDHVKEKKFHGKKQEIQNLESDHFDNVGEGASGTGLNLSSVKEKVETEVTNTKTELFSHQGPRKKSRQLFLEDENTALDALHTLAELSMKLAPMSTVESESYMQLREEEGTFDAVDKSNIPERMLVSLQKDKPKISGAKEKGNHTMNGVNITSHNNAKLGKDSALDGSAFSQAKQSPHQSSSKKRKRKHKFLASKVQVSKYEPHSDTPLNEPQKIKGSDEQGKVSMNKPKSVGQIAPHLKQVKSVRPPQCPSNADLRRAGKNSDVSVVKVSPENQVYLPKKLRSRRKMNLQKALVQELKSPENNGNDQPKYSSSLHERAHDLKEKLSHCFSSPMLRRWCGFEWFYSSIDYPWFAENEFVEFVNHLGLGHVPRLTRAEWGIIRSNLGKARRLSQNFLRGERETLEEHRESVRTANTKVRNGSREVLPADPAWSLSVGQRVMAYHPKTREIHNGSILTVDHNRCRVQFDRPELGVEFVMDFDCMPVNSVENISDALRRPNITVDKVHENFNEPPNIQPKEWKIGGYMNCAPNEILEDADSPSHIPSLTYTGNNSSTQAKIQAREADIRALVDLNHALNKKKILVLDLRHMNDELLKNQNDGDNALKDSEPFKKEYATVLVQIEESNNQVSSALQNLRQRNTYQGNSSPGCRKPVASSGGPGEPLSYFDHSAFINQESVSNVIEIVKSSKWKAQTMVDVAVQVISSLKEGDDVLARIGEVVDSANSRHSGAISGLSAMRSLTTPVPGHCDSACQDQVNSHISEPIGAIHATGLNLNIGSERNELQIPSALISCCVATFLMIQKCTERQYPPAEVAQILDSAVTSLQPCCSQNLPIYREIQFCMGMVKNQILALVPT